MAQSGHVQSAEWDSNGSFYASPILQNMHQSSRANAHTCLLPHNVPSRSAFPSSFTCQSGIRFNRIEPYSAQGNRRKIEGSASCFKKIE